MTTTLITPRVAIRSSSAQSTKTTPSFSTTAGSRLIVPVTTDSGTGGDVTVTVASTSAHALTWTNQVEQDGATNNGGHASVWMSSLVGTGEATTVTVTITAAPVDTGPQLSFAVYQETNPDASPVGANGKGNSTVNNVTLALFISTQANSVGFVCGTDWTASGAFTSSDYTLDSFNYTGFIAVASGFEALGATGAKTANLNAGGTGAVNVNWAAFELKTAQPAGGQPMAKRLGGIAHVAGGLGAGVWCLLAGALLALCEMAVAGG